MLRNLIRKKQARLISFSMSHHDPSSRQRRKALAAETLDILQRGKYTSDDFSENDLSVGLSDSKAGTSSILPTADLLLRGAQRPKRPTTVMDCVDDDTLSAAIRLSELGCSVAALNFASAKHPGGGWLNGAQAQEESVTRRSTLYASLTSEGAQAFYATMRDAMQSGNDGMYTHAMIYSPMVSIIRDATPAEVPIST